MIKSPISAISVPLSMTLYIKRIGLLCRWHWRSAEWVFSRCISTSFQSWSQEGYRYRGGYFLESRHRCLAITDDGRQMICSKSQFGHETWTSSKWFWLNNTQLLIDLRSHFHHYSKKYLSAIIKYPGSVSWSLPARTHVRFSSRTAYRQAISTRYCWLERHRYWYA